MSRACSKVFKGFLYSEPAKAVACTRTEWQALMARYLSAGGRRRVEDGETFIHAKGGALVAEIYANIPAPTGANTHEETES